MTQEEYVARKKAEKAAKNKFVMCGVYIVKGHPTPVMCVMPIWNGILGDFKQAVEVEPGRWEATGEVILSNVSSEDMMDKVSV